MGTIGSLFAVHADASDLDLQDLDGEWQQAKAIPRKAKSQGTGVISSAPKAKMAAKAKAKAASSKALDLLPHALNPLPQRSAPKAMPVMLNGGLAASAVSENAASSAKWAVHE